MFVLYKFSCKCYYDLRQYIHTRADGNLSCPHISPYKAGGMYVLDLARKGRRWSGETYISKRTRSATLQDHWQNKKRVVPRRLARRKGRMMKQFKRLLAVLLAVSMIFALAACNSGKDDDQSKTPDSSQDGTSGDKNNDSQAPAWPDGKTVTIVVPFKVGGNVDLCCRIIADELGKVLDTNVVVENKEGGGAIIGQTYALSQAPDG